MSSAWVIQPVCGGTSPHWKCGAWRRRDYCAQDSASLRLRARSARIDNRSVAGPVNWNTREYADCAKPSAPAVHLSSLRAITRYERALKRGPESFGFTSGLWSALRVRELIEQRTGVRYHEDHVWRILRKLNWSCQRPVGRALERDEQAIGRWKKYRWPQIKKKRSAKGAPSSSSTRAD